MNREHIQLPHEERRLVQRNISLPHTLREPFPDMLKRETFKTLDTEPIMPLKEHPVYGVESTVGLSDYGIEKFLWSFIESPFILLWNTIKNIFTTIVDALIKVGIAVLFINLAFAIGKNPLPLAPAQPIEFPDMETTDFIMAIMQNPVFFGIPFYILLSGLLGGYAAIIFAKLIGILR